jgi:LysR family glycine cleavage system transcriptional activator
MLLPPLAAVRCFEAAARHESFTRAAEELGMTQAAMSYQIKLLEERVGPLFLRKARGVTLTETGRRLAPAIRSAFDELRSAFENLQQTAEGVLAITGVQTFASNWLVPRLGAFQAAHPGIAVRLDLSPRLVDFTREDFDVGIRHVRSGRARGLAVHPLMAVEFTPMLSPRLLEQFGPLRTPADLLKLPLLEPSDEWWPAWFAAAGVAAPDLAARPGMRLGTQHLIGKAAVAGQGVAMLTPAFFCDDLADGRLVRPFALMAREQGDFCLVYPEARRRSAKIKAFRDWILATLAAERQAGHGAAPEAGNAAPA